MLINQFYNLFLKEGKNLFTNENKFEKYVYDPFNRDMSHILLRYLLSPINVGDKGLHIAYLKKVYEHFLVNNKPLNMSSLTRMYSIHS